MLGYITVNRLDPAGVFTTFGVLMVAAGLWFRTPMPVQPMKAIAAVAVSQPGLVTPGAIWASGLFTGALWLALGLTGVATRVARLAGRPVVHGVVLGLGLTLMLEGVKMMARDPVVAVGSCSDPAHRRRLDVEHGRRLPGRPHTLVHAGRGRIRMEEG